MTSAKTKSIVALLMAMLIAVGALFATSTVAFAEENDKDVSFYKVASAARAYYENTHASDSNEENPEHDLDDWHDSNVGAGNAGNYVGFLDEDYNGDGWFGISISQLASSMQTNNYDSFGSEENIRQYMQYGRALNHIGFDSSILTSDFMSTVLRGISGGLMMLFYLLAQAASVVMNVGVSLLQTLNPFSWFYTAIDGGIDGLVDSAAPNSAFSQIVALVDDIYNTFRQLGLMMIPIFLGFMLFSILVIRGSSTATTVRKFFTRFLFIAIGIPLIGAMYTSCLDNLSTITEGDDNAMAIDANYIVGSTFVDFESWVKTSHLGLPQGMTLCVSTNPNDTDNVYFDGVSLRDAAAKINDASGSLSGISNVTDDVVDWNNNVISDTANDVTKMSSVMDLLTRYMTGTTISASDFETFYKTNKVSTEMSGWLTSDIRKYGNVDAMYEDGVVNTDQQLARGNDTDTDNTSFYGDHGVLSATTDGDMFLYTTPAGVWHPIDQGRTASFDYGLSPLSMYNYLTTMFTDTNVNVMSSQKLTSAVVSQNHASVNIIGSGLFPLLYWLNGMLMLIAMSVIGFGYCLSMVFGLIGRGFKVIVKMPIALIGSLRGMAQIVTLVLVMVIEIIVTIFAYQMVMIFLGLLNSAISYNFAGAISDAFTSSSAFGAIIPGVAGAVSPGTSSAVQTVQLIIGIIITAWFTIEALRLRKSIVRAASEAMGRAVDQLFLQGNSGAYKSVMPNATSNSANTLSNMGAGAVSGAAAGIRAATDRKASKGDEATVPGGTVYGDATDTANAKAGDAAGVAENNTNYMGGIEGGDNQSPYMLESGKESDTVEGGGTGRSGDGSASASGGSQDANGPDVGGGGATIGIDSSGSEIEESQSAEQMHSVSGGVDAYSDNNVVADNGSTKSVSADMPAIESDIENAKQIATANNGELKSAEAQSSSDMLRNGQMSPGSDIQTDSVAASAMKGAAVGAVAAGVAYATDNDGIDENGNDRNARSRMSGKQAAARAVSRDGNTRSTSRGVSGDTRSYNGRTQGLASHSSGNRFDNDGASSSRKIQRGDQAQYYMGAQNVRNTSNASSFSTVHQRNTRQVMPPAGSRMNRAASAVDMNRAQAMASTNMQREIRAAMSRVGSQGPQKLSNGQVIRSVNDGNAMLNELRKQDSNRKRNSGKK